MIERETDLDRALKVRLKKSCNVYKIENHAINGMADFYCTLDGLPFWIENKIIRSPVEPIRFRAGQQTFLRINDFNKVKSFVLVYNKTNKGFYVFKGQHSGILTQGTFLQVTAYKAFSSTKLNEVIEWLLKEVRRERYQKPS